MKKKTNYLICTFILVGLLSLLNSSCKKDDKAAEATVKDIDGNVYKTITIGTQIWMVENLKVTKYNDGTAIPLGTTWGYDLYTPAYCWYDNDAATNKETYGALYNWFAISTGKLAPTGWHVPTDHEWSTLSHYLTDSGTDFNAILAGYRYNSNGSFHSKSEDGNWWCSTEPNYNPGCSYSVNLVDIYSEYTIHESQKTDGFSVRCIKN